MASIVFDHVRFQNFLSVGNDPIRIDLSESPTTLISGPNGSGKSTLIDAIVFALFGKPYRSVNKASLVNSVNQQNCMVEIAFYKGDDYYYVKRTIGKRAGTGTFEIFQNGQKLEEDGSSKEYQKHLEQSILGFGYKAFCQTSMIGSSDYVPFMRLTTQARRQLIETLLDIGVFSDMNKILKQEVNQWKEQVRDVSEQYKLKKVEYDSEYKRVQSRQEDVQEQVDRKEQQIGQLHERKQGIQTTLDDIDDQLAEFNRQYLEQELNDIRTDLAQHDKKLGQLTNQVKTAKQQIEFFRSYDHCPTCEQPITEQLSHDACKKHAETGRELGEEYKRRQEQREQLNEKYNQVKQHLESLRQLEDQRKQYVNQLHQIDENIEQLHADVKQIKPAEGNDHSELDRLAGELQQLSQQYNDLIQQSDVYEQATALLKDNGIKASIIKQYLPILNAKVNEYLQLLNFPVRFELDEEFNESLQSRYRNEFTYANFSMGERQRLDISLLFAWRDVAQMKNSVSTNLLILDETLDASLDMQGTDDLLAIVQRLCNDNNVFIVSHKGLLEDKLTSHIRMTTMNGFTKVVE